MKIRLLTLMAAIVMIGFTGCKKAADDSKPSSGTNPKSVDATCGSATYDLTCGQYNKVGTLTVANDETNLYVTYTLTNGGTFGTLHLWAGTDLSLVPSNPQGTPVPGHFPYISGNDNPNKGLLFPPSTGLSTYTFTVPLSDIAFYKNCGDKLYVIAHAESECGTAFGGNIGVNIETPGRWYFYAQYTTVCCGTPPPDNSNVRLGTAFAKGGYVFTTDKKSNPENLPSLKLTLNRWGWANNLIAPGEYTSSLWVGAGLNNTTKALKVGSATVKWDGYFATVTYNTVFPYTIEEVHTYAGDFKPITLAPGQYGNTGYLDPKLNSSTTITFSDMPLSDTNGDGAWFIIHAVIWGPGVTNP